jgi:hypothetical protein
MAKLIYSTITSLDGYVADEDGNFDWAAPDEEVHTTSALTGVSVRPGSGFRCGQWCSACCGHTWVVCSRSITILPSV